MDQWLVIDDGYTPAIKFVVTGKEPGRHAEGIASEDYSDRPMGPIEVFDPANRTGAQARDMMDQWTYVAGEDLRRGDLLHFCTAQGVIRPLCRAKVGPTGLIATVGVSGGDFAAGTPMKLDTVHGQFVAAAGPPAEEPRAETWRDRPALL